MTEILDLGEVGLITFCGLVLTIYAIDVQSLILAGVAFAYLIIIFRLQVREVK